MNFTYHKDQELPSISVLWEAGDGAPMQFATGWTFSLKICLTSAPFTIVATKTAGLTGADVFPNVTIDWATTDFSALTATDAGTQYTCYLYARRTADSKDAVFPGMITFTLKTAPA